MKTSDKTEAAEQDWGIYLVDREYARELGDPLRTVVRTPSKEDAEREAERLGFGSAWAHPLPPVEINHAEWLPVNLRHRPRTRSRRKGVRV